MSRMRITAAQILPDCPMVIGFGGWGVLGSALPATGEHGPSIGYQWADLPADNAKEFWVYVTTPPAVGTLYVHPDSSFDYDGTSTTFEAQLVVDSVAVGTPQTVTVSIGGVNYDLVIQSVTHAHAADNLTLTASDAATLDVASTAHAHIMDSLALSTAATLVVQNVLHAHPVESLTLSAALALVIDSASHAHTVEAATLLSGLSLTVQDTAHTHTLDGLALDTSIALAIHDATHSLSVDDVTLTTITTLLINDAVHAHFTDSVALYVPTETLSAMRTLAIAVENRVLAIRAESRSLAITDENRIRTIQ